jgi:peroxiredoxin
VCERFNKIARLLNTATSVLWNRTYQGRHLLRRVGQDGLQNPFLRPFAIGIKQQADLLFVNYNPGRASTLDSHSTLLPERLMPAQLFHKPLKLALYAFCLLGSTSALATDDPKTPAKDADPGHSFHAEAFNEGPRQAAYLMPGMGNVHWKVSTTNPMAQRFFDQGIAQLHGFWYFEAERSFRQAASIDPDRAIFYWGMARANTENPERSAGFIEQAVKRIDQSSPLERRLIEAWSRRVKDWPKPPAESKSPDAKPDEKKGGSGNKKKPNVTEEVREKRKDRYKTYARELDEIVQDYPEEIELKAMLVLQLWQNQSQGHDIQSYTAVDSMLEEIFRRNPRHPAHHFRIHLWDYRKEKLALRAAAECGPSAPGIAHMWHMPGHTYSRLHRYADAAWQQEASARVDHAHMMRDRIMPDQIHNFAHNNEWLIRNWLNIGRPSDALSLAKNMIELPRHPKYNSTKSNGSSNFGRQRLLQTLRTYRLWPQASELVDSVYLLAPEGSVRADEVQMLRGIAAWQTGKKEQGESILQGLKDLRRALIIEVQAANQPSGSSKQSPPMLLEASEAPKDLWGEERDLPFVDRVSQDFDEGKWKDKSKEEIEKQKSLHEKNYRSYRLAGCINALEAYAAAHRGDFRQAVRRASQARDTIDLWQRIDWAQAAGEHEIAIAKARDAFNGSEGEVLPGALFAIVAHRAIEAKPQAKQIDQWKQDRSRALERCAKLAWACEPEIPSIQQAKQIASSVSPELAWQTTPPERKDLGDRPSLDSLGPVRWAPPVAPSWSLAPPEIQSLSPLASSQKAPEALNSSASLRGKPYIMILYLGFGCLHCTEQLKTFSPKYKEFKDAGLELVGISTEDPQSLAEGLKQFDGTMDIPLMANSDLDVFKSFRCFDDFEGQPLHGTILVDAQGRIRWQDIGYEPFTDADFLLEEAKRLLALP